MGPDVRGYFQKGWPTGLILGSFFALTIPLCLLVGDDEPTPTRISIGLVYVCVLGMTHFVLTLSVYCQGANLRHFWSTPANRLTYFGLPAAIFVVFDLYHAVGVAVALPVFDLFVRGGIRLMDFGHFGRQSFGVMQLFRARSGFRFPDSMKRLEDQYFAGLTLLLFVTYLSGGHFQPAQPASWVALGVAAILLVRVLMGYVAVWSGSGPKGRLAAPMAYLLLQTGSAGLATWSTSFYAFALAMHYVEYHILMIPRCFHSKLDDGSSIDRLFGRFRGHKVLFYGTVLALAALVSRMAWLGMSSLIRADSGSSGATSRVLLAAFDGLFVFHYFVESRIWKFADPYYRQSLTPLYFGAKPAPVARGDANLEDRLDCPESGRVPPRVRVLESEPSHADDRRTSRLREGQPG